jgi:hypothetical protein
MLRFSMKVNWFGWFETGKNGDGFKSFERFLNIKNNAN